MGMLGGTGYGALVGVRGIRERFIQVHQATIFEKPSEAKVGIKLNVPKHSCVSFRESYRDLLPG